MLPYASLQHNVIFDIIIDSCKWSSQQLEDNYDSDRNWVGRVFNNEVISASAGNFISENALMFSTRRLIQIRHNLTNCIKIQSLNTSI